MCGDRYGFHFPCRGNRPGHVFEGVFDVPLTGSSLLFVSDSALDDFVLTHCVFIPNSQLCPVLSDQYPFAYIKEKSFSQWNVVFAVALLIFNSSAATMPRPHKAQRWRNWTTRSTTSAGWSAWWWNGLLCMEKTCSSRTWSSLRSVGLQNSRNKSSWL